MKSMQWKLAAGCALLGLCSFAAYAQSGEPQGPPPDAQGDPPPGDHERMPGPDRELKTLTRLLTLTTDQQAGVKAVLEEQSSQMRALRAKGENATPESETPATRQARWTQMEQIRDESYTKIAALLDDNQKKAFADWIQKRKAAMERQRSEGDNPPPPPDGAGPPLAGPGGGPPPGAML